VNLSTEFHAFDIQIDWVALCFGGQFVLDANAFARIAVGRLKIFAHDTRFLCEEASD
jgi:hypothetical protein